MAHLQRVPLSAVAFLLDSRACSIVLLTLVISMATRPVAAQGHDERLTLGERVAMSACRAGSIRDTLGCAELVGCAD